METMDSDIRNELLKAREIVESIVRVAKEACEKEHKFLERADNTIPLAAALEEKCAIMTRKEKQASDIESYLKKQVRSLEATIAKQKRTSSDIEDHLKKQVESLEATIAKQEKKTSEIISSLQETIVKEKASVPELLDSFECPASGLSIKGKKQSLLCYLQSSFSRPAFQMRSRYSSKTKRNRSCDFHDTSIQEMRRRFSSVNLSSLILVALCPYASNAICASICRARIGMLTTSKRSNDSHVFCQKTFWSA